MGASVVVLGSWACLAAAGASTPSKDSGARVTLRFEGAVATLTVERPLPDFGDAAKPHEVHVDILPPDGAALVDLSLLTEGRWRSLAEPKSSATSTSADTLTSSSAQAYGEALRSMGLERTPLDVDDDLRFRVRVAVPAHGPRPTRLRYRLACPVTVVDGNHVRVTVPPDAESVQGSARLRIEAPHLTGLREVTVGANAKRVHGATTEATVDLRGSWEVSLTLDPPRGAAPLPRVEGFVTLSSPADKGGPAAAYSLRVQPDLTLAPWPELVVIAVDRSRSVGAAGLGVERDMLREVLEHLPRNTRVEIIFFDRSATPLYPAPRTATGELLGALDEAMRPDDLANGSRFDVAAGAVARFLRAEMAVASPPPSDTEAAASPSPGAALPSSSWVIFLTDGAFGETPPNEETMARAFGKLAVPGLHVAALAVRPHGDTPFSPTTERGLRALAAGAHAPFVTRLLREEERKDGVADVLADLRAGGELAKVALERGADSFALHESLSHSEAVRGVRPLTSRDGAASPKRLGGASRWSWSRAGTRESVPAPVATAEPGVVSALAGSPRPGAIATPWLAALVEPLRAPSPLPSTPPAPGHLERSVVRDHLSLRFLPRARACYQKRAGLTAALRDLEGRVRLGLDLARGELTGVEVLGQNLGRGEGGGPAVQTAAEKAEIEKMLACLEEAAYTLDVPPTYMNDDGVRAVLNLHFRPYKQERRNQLDDAVSSELDVLLERQGVRATAQSEATTGAVTGPLPGPPSPSPGAIRVPMQSR